MKRISAALFALSLFATSALAQTPPVPLGPSGGGAAIGGGGGVTVGAAITGTCPNGDVLFSSTGTIGCEVVSGTGTVTSVSFTGGLFTIANPTTTPAFTLAGTSGGIPYFSSTTTWASSGLLAANALMIGGGSAAAPSTTTTGAGVLTALGVTINASTGLPNVDGAITTGHCLQWGPGVQDAGAVCGTGGGGGLTVGTTTITSGTSGDIEFNNAGVLGEKGVTGTGSVVVLATSPTLVTPTLGVATSTSEAIGGATLGSNALAVTGLGNFASVGSAPAPTLSVGNQTTGVYSVSTTGLGFAVNGVVKLDYGITNGSAVTASGFFSTSNIQAPGTFGVNSTTGIFAINSDTTLSRHAAANWQLGAADAAAPVAQTLGVQSVVAGTSNTAGANWSLNGSVSTGSGTSGDVIFKTGGTGAAATTQNAEVAALTLKGATQLAQLNSSSYVSCGTLSTNGTGVIGCGAGPAPLTTGGSGSLTGSYGYWICTTTCSIALPTPAAGAQFCIRNDSAVTTVITISAIASVQFEKTTYNGYGTVTTGTMVSGGALGDKICLIGRDATHYLVGSFVGTWTNS